MSPLGLVKERGQSHLKRPRYDISEDDTPRDPEQITPDPHYKLASSSTAYAFQPTYNREFEVWTGLESTAENGSETSRNFLRPCSNPSSASSSSCDSTTSSQVTWSRSPVQCIADLRTAARPTRFKYSDAASATEAGGVLGRYQRLRAIHNAHQVIPSSLRVSTPE